MSEQTRPIDIARGEWMQGSYARAYDLYEYLLKNHAADAELLSEYARAKYDEFEDLERSVELFQKALEAKPHAAEIMLWLGDLYAMGYGKGYQAAASMYDHAIAAQPHCADAYIGKGLLYDRPTIMTSLEDAIDAYKTAVQFSPDRVDAHYNLAMALIKSGDVVHAERELLIAEHLLTAANHSNQVEGVKSIINRLRRKEAIDSFAFWNLSPRYEKGHRISLT